MKSLLLPWEILERIIDHSGDHPKTLSSISCTCRQLRPRSRRVMFSEVVLKSRDQIFALVDFLQANPHLRPLVCSIVVPPTDFGPSLLYLLPNLSEVRCIPSIPQSTQPILALHHLGLAYFRRLGTRVQALHLVNVSFATCMAFARVLLALANVTHLVCAGVSVQVEGDRALLDAVRRHLVGKMQLKTLAVDSRSLHGSGGNPSIGPLLFDPDFAPSTVDSLRLMGTPESNMFLHLSGWSRLGTLVLQLPSFEWGNVANAAVLLEDLYRPTLKEVEVGLELDSVTGLQVMGELLSYSRHRPQVYEDLERALLRIPEARLECIVKAPMRAGSASFWTQQFGEYLPGLVQRGVLVVKSDQPVLPTGHGARLLALVVSPSSKWVASGSDDSTIILWDATGHIAQRWVAHDYKSVLSLAFSPDSRRLVSVARHGKVAVWDLSQNVRQVSTLQGHTGTVVSCTWSPDGNVIATRSWDETARLWDAHTFRQLRVLQMPGHWQIQSVAFSPDGRWLCSWSSWDYWIWDVMSGTLHKCVRPTSGTDLRGTGILTAFHPGSMRLAVAFGTVTVEIWDVGSEAGGRLFVLEQRGWVTDVSFSPDGKLLLAVLENRMLAKIWDAYTGIELFQLQGHTRGVSAACFSPCGRYIASASWDSTVRLWVVSDGSCVATFREHEQPVEHVAFSPDGKTLLSATIDGAVVFQRIHDA